MSDCFVVLRNTRNEKTTFRIMFVVILETLLIFIGFIWIRRVVWIAGLRKKNPPLLPVTYLIPSPPKVSIIIPAKDEEKNIENCLRHLLAQNYPEFEIIVVDDRSTDKTPEILKNMALGARHGVPLPRIIRIEKLPPGWTGKNYAMFTGSKAASGAWLLFTDADTTHKPESLATAMAVCLDPSTRTENVGAYGPATVASAGRRAPLHFLTLSPETESKSFWENVIQPLASGSLALWFNPEKINDPDEKRMLANGQFILVKKEVYEKVGGNEGVKNEVVEDVALARKIKTAGFRVAFLNGSLLYRTRMYDSLKAIQTGWTRIFIYLFEKNVWAILHKIFLFLFFSCLPFFILIYEIVLKMSHSVSYSGVLLALSLSLCGLITTVRFVGNKMVKSNPWYAFTHLLGSLVMVWILAGCIVRIVFKKPSVWRGDHYR